MDRTALLARITSATDELVLAGGRGSPRFRRLNRIARRLRLEALRARHSPSAYQLERGSLHPIRRRLDRLKLVAFDLEWSATGGPFDELGIAVWRDGAFESVRNLRTAPPRGSDASLHCATETATHEEAIAVLVDELADADFVVTHAGANDRTRLAVGGWRLPPHDVLPRIDVQSWHRMAVGRNAPSRLRDLAERWSIRFRGRHVAANDAVATMRVALAMVRHGPDPTGLTGPFTEPVPKSLRTGRGSLTPTTIRDDVPPEGLAGSRRPPSTKPEGTDARDQSTTTLHGPMDARADGAAERPRSVTT